MDITQRWWGRALVMWVCQCAVLVTANMLNFALIWQLASQHDAAVALSAAGAISLIPSIVLAPLIGWVVDRYAHRRIMLAAELLSLVPLWLTWHWHTTAVAWVIYVVVIVRAIGTAFYTTAWQAAWPQLIPVTHLQRLSSMPQIVLGAASLLTPVCGAAIVASQQWDWAVLVALIALCVSMGVVWLVVPPVVQATVAAPWWHDWQHVWHEFQARPGMFGVLVVAMVLNCVVMPVFSLLPYIVNAHVHAGAWVLATSEIVGGVGLVCGVGVLAWWGGFPHVIHTLISAILILALGFGLMAVLPATPFVLYLFVGVLGWSAAWIHGPLTTAVQINVPTAMHGRALSLLTAAMNAATPLGILLAGYAVAWWGVRLWAGGVAVVIVVVVLWTSRGAVMQLKGRAL